MEYIVRVVLGTLVAIVAYLFGRSLLRKIVGDDSELLGSGRWRYFVTQIGELALAIVSVIIAALFSFIISSLENLF